jgi:hypothetical protein
MPALRALLVAVTALLSMGAGCEPPVEVPPPPAEQEETQTEQETAPKEEAVGAPTENESVDSAPGEGNSSGGGAAEEGTAEGGSTEAGGDGSAGPMTAPGASTPDPANGGGDLDESETGPAGSASAQPHRRFSDAKAAASHANDQLKKGKRMTPSGASIEVLLDGWRAAGEHPTNSKCSSVASELLAELRRHDRVVSGNPNARPFDDMPLKIR